MNKLYVGNLSYDLTNDDLNAAFAQCGQVISAKIIMDRDTGRSKGFAFVEMTDSEGAKKAIAELDGKELKGRALRVSEAKPQAPRTGGGGGYGDRPRGGGYGGGGDRGGDRGGYGGGGNDRSGGGGGYGGGGNDRSSGGGGGFGGNSWGDSGGNVDSGSDKRGGRGGFGGGNRGGKGGGGNRGGWDD
jgi:RNA recognition motif-containing protein